MRTAGVANLVPDNSNLANRIGQIFDQKKATAANEANNAKVQELTRVIATGTPEEKEQARQQLAVLSPQSSNALNTVIKSQQEQKVLQAQTRAKEVAVNSLNVRDLPDLTSKRTQIAKLAQADLKAGKDISAYEKLLEIQDVDELNLALTKTATKAGDVDKFIESKLNPGSGSFSKSPGVIVKQEDGSFAQSIPILNQKTGQIENKLVPIDGQPVSRLGETPEAIQNRAITTAGGTTAAEQAAETAAVPEKEKITAIAKRQQDFIDKGFVAADSIATFDRGLELLESVKTGGFDAAALKAKQLFGIESADEAELSNSLGKAVLAQLRDTFGAAFTAQEGSSLKEIEASFGKSVAGNKALLKRARRIAQRAVNRGIKAAKDTGDNATALEIEEAAKFKIAPEEKPANVGRFKIEIVQ